MIQINVTSHMSPLLKWSQRQRSVQSFALDVSNKNKVINYFIEEGMIGC